jgi:hypothetical protein
MPARKLPDDYRALAKARGLTWLEPEVPDTETLGSAIVALLVGKAYQEIVLPDWGQGNTQISST